MLFVFCWMEKIIFLKYGELNTKGDNRSFFINKIYDNLEIVLENNIEENKDKKEEKK